MLTMTQMKQPVRPRVLCCWELGGDLGHISRLSAITNRLQGHCDISVALRDLSHAGAFFSNQVRLLQAPVYLQKITMQRPIACLADTLLLSGYLKAEALQSLLKAWQGLVDLVKPDLIIYDYAPTALLATHQLSTTKITVGTGFTDGVPGQPIADWRPSFGGTHSYHDDLIQRQEQTLLQVINQALCRNQQPKLKQLSEIFAVDATLLSTFPQLDLYADSIQGREYALAKTSATAHKKITLPNNQRRNIVAYIKPGYAQLDLLLKALQQCQANCLLVSPGANPKQLTVPTGSTLQIQTQLIDLKHAIAQADLFIGHGNMASSCESLQLGKPVLALPMQLEQLLTAEKLQQLGLGKLVEKIQSPQQLSQQINNLVADKTLVENANRFSQANESVWKTCMAERIFELCREKLKLEARAF